MDTQIPDRPDLDAADADRRNALGALDAITRVFTGDPFVPHFNTS